MMSIKHINPEDSAQKMISKWNTLRIVLLYFGAGTRYIESGRLVVTLPEGVEIVNRAELENLTSRIEYGGGSYGEENIRVEEREGKPAVVVSTLTVITTENITITQQEFAQQIEG